MQEEAEEEKVRVGLLPTDRQTDQQLASFHLKEEVVEEAAAEEKSKSQFLPKSANLRVVLYLLDPCYVHAHDPKVSHCNNT